MLRLLSSYLVNLFPTWISIFRKNIVTVNIKFGLLNSVLYIRLVFFFKVCMILEKSVNAPCGYYAMFVT